LDLAAVGQVLLAGLLCRLDLGVVGAGTPREPLGDPVPHELRVGHVGEAVLAHTPGERQRLPEVVADVLAAVGVAEPPRLATPPPLSPPPQPATPTASSSRPSSSRVLVSVIAFLLVGLDVRAAPGAALWVQV
jgi:hypothetical protein